MKKLLEEVVSGYELLAEKLGEGQGERDNRMGKRYFK
jgi:hypothetical protein